MNVCLISREFPPFVGGGIGAYTARYASALTARGHHPVVVTVSDDGREHRDKTHGVTVIRLPFIRGRDWTKPDPNIDTPEHRAAFSAFHPVSVFAMQIARALPGLIDEFAIDAIEAPDTGALGWFALNDRRLGRPWSAGRQPPLITVIHSPTAWINELNQDPLSDPRDRALAAMEAESLAWSDALVCPSDAVARWTARWLPAAAGRIQVVPNPLGDLERPAADAARGEQQLPPRAGALRVFFSGRLEPRKGFDTLVRAFEIATLAGLDLELDVAGRDTADPRTGRPFGAQLLATLSDAIRARIRVHGQRPPDEVARLRRAAHVAVLPSPTDNFPYTCVEAMADARVVVASRAGGMAEMIRDGREGLLFEAGDPGACAEALRRAAALTPEQARRMGRAAATRILALCGNDRIVEIRTAHYRKCPRFDVRAELAQPVVLVNPAASGAGALLADAVRWGTGIDFAHGWVRDAQGHVLAFGTPSPDALKAPGPPLGPLAVSARALADPRVAPLVERRGSIGSTRSTRALAGALDRAGYLGAVVPQAVSPVPRQGFLARAFRRLSRTAR